MTRRLIDGLIIRSTRRRWGRAVAVPGAGRQLLLARWARTFLWIALATLAVGCASSGPKEGVGSAAGPTMLEVTNHNWQDMHIYVQASGQRWSLGLVTTNSARSFELPRGVFASGRDVVLVADPIGSNVPYHSDPVLLEPGDRVEWRLENRLSQSRLFVL